MNGLATNTYEVSESTRLRHTRKAYYFGLVTETDEVSESKRLRKTRRNYGSRSFSGNLFLVLSLLGMLFLFSNTAFACVGRTLYIGALQTPSETLMAEMLATLINERTGTTIQIRYFKDRDAIYTALKSNVEEKRADILVENTLTALTILGTNPTSPDKDFIAAKDAYEKEFGVIWLNSFGFNNSSGKAGQSISAPLVRRDVLTNFPLLPRILNKLAGVITNKAYDKLQAEVAAGEKPKNAAKNFLKKRKLI